MNRTGAWLSFWMLFGVGNFIASKYHNSLCETVRADLHLDTPAGQVAFTALLGGGAAVLHRHVLKPFRR